MEDEISIERDAKWNRLECVESVMDYDEFMELVREQVNMYYDGDEAFESNSGSIPGDYRDDCRASILVKYIHHELENGDKQSQWAVLQAVLKGYMDFINAFSWIMGYRVVPACPDAYNLTSHYYVTRDLEKALDFVILNETFCKPEMGSVRRSILNKVEKREAMML